MDPFNTTPTADELAKFEQWINSLSPKLQEIIRNNNLSQWTKYALESNPLRATYFRIYSLSECICGEAHHMVMLAFKHDGSGVICAVGNINVMNLRPYPYSETNPPGADVLKKEEELISELKKSRRLATTVLTGTLPGTPSELETYTVTETHETHGGDQVRVDPVEEKLKRATKVNMTQRGVRNDH